MIEMTSFLLASYLTIALSYTIASWIDVQYITKYWYLLPLGFCWCLSICWIHFPYDIGTKLYKKLNEEEKEKR